MGCREARRATGLLHLFQLYSCKSEDTLGLSSKVPALVTIQGEFQVFGLGVDQTGQIGRLASSLLALASVALSCMAHTPQLGQPFRSLCHVTSFLMELME